MMNHQYSVKGSGEKMKRTPDKTWKKREELVLVKRVRVNVGF